MSRLAGVVSAGRRAAERLQTDRCTITRAAAAADATFDEDTGVATPPAPTTIYSGQCRLRAVAIQDIRSSSGEHMWTLQDQILSVPVCEADVAVDDDVLITASQLDPGMVDRRYVVRAVLRGSQITARRMVVREVTG